MNSLIYEITYWQWTFSDAGHTVHPIVIKLSDAVPVNRGAVEVFQFVPDGDFCS